jgi:Neuraminidase (sialidase)
LGSPLHDDRGLEHNKEGHTSNDGGKTWVHPEK